MPIRIHPHLDPTVEVITFLERTVCADGSIPDSLEKAVGWYSEKYSIPAQELEPLIAPLLPMEAELRELLLPREELWSAMFYPNSRAENLMAWSFFFLETQNELDFQDLALRRRLMALTLNCALSSLEPVEDVGSLMVFLSGVHCSDQTKWICAQLWQEPERFYLNYRTLAALAAPVVSKYDTLLLPLCRRVTEQTLQLLNSDPDTFWAPLGMNASESLNNMAIYPMSNNFNGVGIIWDHTCPQAPAFVMIGLLRSDIQELEKHYGDNSEFLTDRLKSLSDQRRIEILKALKNAPMYGQELADLLHLSPATISHHMSTLVAAGFVSVDRKGARTSYTIHRQNLNSFLQNLRTALL